MGVLIESNKRLYNSYCVGYHSQYQSELDMEPLLLGNPEFRINAINNKKHVVENMADI